MGQVARGDIMKVSAKRFCVNGSQSTKGLHSLKKTAGSFFLDDIAIAISELARRYQLAR